MAGFPFELLNRPIAGDEPCGPSLEMDGDAAYMQFTSRFETLLPLSFARFDRSQIDFNAEFASLQALMSRSVDLQLIVPLAKLSILNRDLDGFAKAIAGLRDCLRDRWEHVHPMPMDGDPVMRIICVQTLDDIPNTIMPLQSAPLFKARRFGVLTYRSQLLADGKIQVAAVEEGEEESKIPTVSDIRTAAMEADLDALVAARDMVVSLSETVAEIEALFDAQSGQPGAMRLPNLRSLLGDICKFMESCVVIKDPSQASVSGADAAAADGEAGSAEGAGLVTGPVGSIAAARLALSGASAYFAAHEPSSPVRMLVAQAEALVGKSFFEALQALVPEHFSQAAVRLGRDMPLTLSVETLSQLVGGDSANEGEAGDDMLPVPASRNEALAMMDQASAFFRAREPSSPIPLLLDQARAAAGRDFVGLLRDFLPSHLLRVDG